MSPQEIISMTNEYRKANGLSPLNSSISLQAAAQARANDMAVTGNFSHDIATTTQGMQRAWGFIQKSGYPYAAAGENLATLYDDAPSAMNGWRNSPTHNKNLLESRYADIGVAVVPAVYQGKQTYFIVQLFGSPKKGKVVQPQVKGVATVKERPVAARPVEKPVAKSTFIAPPVDMRMAASTRAVYK